jgi:hypothetical protein
MHCRIPEPKIRFDAESSRTLLSKRSTIVLFPIHNESESFILLFLFSSLLPTIHAQFNATLTNWIATENTTALSRIFANIGPISQFVPDADPGAIVAAPSTASPNYYYQAHPIS